MPPFDFWVPKVEEEEEGPLELLPMKLQFYYIGIPHALPLVSIKELEKAMLL